MLEQRGLQDWALTSSLYLHPARGASFPDSELGSSSLRGPRPPRLRQAPAASRALGVGRLSQLFVER